MEHGAGNEARQPDQLKDEHPREAKDISTAVAKPANPPFYSDYLSIVSFVATITLGASISGSQGFATAGSLFGHTLNDEDNSPATKVALERAATAAIFFAWSTAASAVSLMVTLVLQLAITKPVFAERLTGRLQTPTGLNWNIVITSVGSYAALGLQAASLALIGQALKVVNRPCGLMIQWSLLAVGSAGLLLFAINVKRYIES